jgi:hypothetical protein
VAGRALVFSNPEVIRLLQTDFVPYAGDQWYLHRQQDEAGRFFWKVAQQGYRRDAPVDETRQGVYAATPDGELLGSLNHPGSAPRNIEMMHSALAQWQKRTGTETAAASRDTDAEYLRRPPDGGLILNVFSRIPLPPPAGVAWTPNQATGRDHLWITREEWHSLLPTRWENGATYPVPRALAMRLLRFHLVDNVRGEPDMWTEGDVHQADLHLRVDDADAGRLRLEGSAKMERENRRGYEARVQGFLTYDRKREQFTRFDLLSWGEAWGTGTFTGGAPPGRFPLVIAASLAGDTPGDRIPPQASRDLGSYFGAGR